jgi:hypothetical protein
MEASFWVDVPTEVADSPSHYLGFLLEELDPFARFAQLRGLVTGYRRPRSVDTVFAVGDLEPAMQTGLGDPDVLRDLTQRPPRPCGPPR